MKRIVALAAAAVALGVPLIVATRAQAARISPSTGIVARGSTTYSYPLGSFACTVTLTGSIAAGTYRTGDTFGTITGATAACPFGYTVRFLTQGGWKVNLGAVTLDQSNRILNLKATLVNVQMLVDAPGFDCLYRGNVKGLAQFNPNPGNPVMVTGVAIGDAIGDNTVPISSQPLNTCDEMVHPGERVNTVYTLNPAWQHTEP